MANASGHSRTLDFAGDISGLEPGALFPHFANPSACDGCAFPHAPGVNVVGVCNVGITTKMRLLALWEKVTGEKSIHPAHSSNVASTPHWHRGLDRRVEVRPQIFPAFLEWERGKGAGMGFRDARDARNDADYYLRYYYSPRRSS
jgi:hypothetical protein